MDLKIYLPIHQQGGEGQTTGQLCVHLWSLLIGGAAQNLHPNDNSSDHKARGQLRCSFPFFSFQLLHSACIPHLAMLCPTDYRLVLKGLSPAKPEKLKCDQLFATAIISFVRQSWKPQWATSNFTEIYLSPSKHTSNNLGTKLLAILSLSKVTVSLIAC